MNIDVGEYFIVKRGIELNTSTFSLAPTDPFMDSILGTQNENKPPQYDRSHEGLIYKALQICGEHIAAECIYAEGYKSATVGKRISLNTSEVEIWPLTKKYVACLFIKKSAERSQ